jgi:hypothetical protein
MDDPFSKDQLPAGIESEFFFDSCCQFFGFSSAAQTMVLGCVSVYASFISSTSSL